MSWNGFSFYKITGTLHMLVMQVLVHVTKKAIDIRTQYSDGDCLWHMLGQSHVWYAAR